MAKRLDTPYEPGRRSRSWLKHKHRRQETFAVTGWRPASRPRPWSRRHLRRPRRPRRQPPPRRYRRARPLSGERERAPGRASRATHRDSPRRASRRGGYLGRHRLPRCRDPTAPRRNHARGARRRMLARSAVGAHCCSQACWGRCHAPMKLRRTIPDRRRATQRKVVRPNGRQPERESARRRSRSLHLTSDVADNGNRNSKPESGSDAPTGVAAAFHANGQHAPEGKSRFLESPLPQARHRARAHAAVVRAVRSATARGLRVSTPTGLTLIAVLPVDQRKAHE